MTWIKQHILLFLLIVAVLAGVIWYGLSSGSSAPPLLTTDEPIIGGTLAQTSAEQEIVGTLLALRAVTLSGTIFSDPAFTTLQDFGTTIVPEAAGRPNPFAPLTSRGAVTTATSSAIFAPRR